MADLCDTCENSPHPGILWPWMPNGDDSLPWVVRCDDCDIYDTDDAAAIALSKLVGQRVMWAEDYSMDVDTETVHVRDLLRPFVFAFDDSSMGGSMKRGGLRQVPPDDRYQKWLIEHDERFSRRRARYDDAVNERRKSGSHPC